jgi:hypothetical protein
MTQDEIIEMAIEAKLPHYWQSEEIVYIERIEHFAKLVAQHEREACAYRAGIALLGADHGLSNRVNQAIRARGRNAP